MDCDNRFQMWCTACDNTFAAGSSRHSLFIRIRSDWIAFNFKCLLSRIHSASTFDLSSLLIESFDFKNAEFEVFCGLYSRRSLFLARRNVKTIGLTVFWYQFPLSFELAIQSINQHFVSSCALQSNREEKERKFNETMRRAHRQQTKKLFYVYA